MEKRSSKALAVLLGVVVAGLYPIAAMAQEVPRTTKEDLKALLGKPGVVLLDVRSEESWTNSDQKISGAVREDPSQVKSWIDKYQKDSTIVLYCA